jgi:segregation and condensation protein A
MSDDGQFDTALSPDLASDEKALIIDVEGFEGPLDLLLSLARNQKVDLAKISILALAEQYLAFIEEARRIRLELAADYLVMAAWLAYLKSRLLLPEKEGEAGPTAEDMATALALRLQRLEAIRLAADQLSGRAQLGRDVFGRGAPEPIADIKRPEWTATLYDLLTAYAAQRQKSALAHVRFAQRSVWSLSEARTALERLVGATEDWGRLDEFLISYLVDPAQRATVLASSFASVLEMVREGAIEVQQTGAFTPIFLRKKPDDRPAIHAVPN